MNDFPRPPAGPASAPRNRRSGRPQPSKRKNVRRRTGAGKKRPSLGLTVWQGMVLLALAVALIVCLLSLGQANRNLRALNQKREEERLAYERQVANHQMRYRDYIEYYAALYQVDPAYVAAIIKRESDYDPRAVSRVGAMGLMQFMPSTFDWVAPNCGIKKSNLDALYDPESAIKMGCYLLNYIAKKFDGDPVLVACAYHAGWGNVNGWVEKYSTDGKTLTIDQIPMSDTRDYAGKVLKSYAIYQQHYD